MIEMVSNNQPKKLSCALIRKHKLTGKQAGFIRNYLIPGTTATQALIEAGYHPRNRINAGKMASEVLGSPRVMSALDEIIYGGKLDQKVAEVYDEFINLDTKNCTDEQFKVRADVKLKVIQQLNKLTGKEAPKKTEHTRKSVSFQGFLPKGTATNPSGSVNVTAEVIPNPPESKPNPTLVLPVSDAELVEEKEPKE